MKDSIKRIVRLLQHGVWAACVMLAASACGASAPADTPLPTVTRLPTYEYVPPTEAPAIKTAAANGTATAAAAAAQGEPTLDPARVEFGRGRYVALECGKCHGEKGEGTKDGSALVPTKLSQEEFITFLRTGGTLGNDHLFSSNRLSDNGGRGLYLYIVSLGQ
jgi:mono/diheme cytochrome c family protein